MSDTDAIAQVIATKQPPNSEPSSSPQKTAPPLNEVEPITTDDYLREEYNRTHNGTVHMNGDAIAKAVAQGVQLGEHLAAAQQAGVMAAHAASMASFLREYATGVSTDINDSLSVDVLAEALERTGVDPVKKTLASLCQEQPSQVRRLRPASWMNQ